MIAGPRSLSGQFARFLAAGGFAALANFASRFLFSEFMVFEAAVVLAYLVGLTTAFLLNRRYVFLRSGNSLRKEIVYFVLVNVLALAQTWLVSAYLARVLVPELGVQLGEASAHFVGVAVPAVTSYIGHKYLTFREDPA